MRIAARLRKWLAWQPVSDLARGDAARDLQDWETAHAAYDRHLARRPDDWRIWVQRGHALKEINRLEDAALSYATALSLTDDPDPVLHQAFLLKRLGRQTEAELEFRKLVGTEHERLALEQLGAAGRASDSSASDSPRSAHVVDEDYELMIDDATTGQVRGWAVSLRDPSAVFSLAVQVDGVPFGVIRNDRHRSDLLKLGKSAGQGGFLATVPPGLMSDASHVVSVTVESRSGSPSASVQVAGAARASRAIEPAIDVDVAVVVPIFNAYDDVKVCLERLRDHTTRPATLVLIDDASTDGRIGDLLREAEGWSNVEVLTNPTNQGFTRTVNRGIKRAGRRDVVILNSDARVTPGWLDGLRQAAASDPRIATVTAMSDRAGVFSAPDAAGDNPVPPGCTEEDYAIAFRRRSGNLYPVVPTGNGFCMYIRRAALDEIGPFDAEAFPRGYGEENDFCMRALRAGWKHIVDDRTYVFHERGQSFGESKTALLSHGRQVLDRRYPEYGKLARTVRDLPAMVSARERAKQAQFDTAAGVRPRVLFVVSTETGGTPQTNRDLMNALRDRWDCWLLRCDTVQMTLSRMVEREMTVVRSHTLAEAINPITFASFEYDRVIASWLAEFGFDVVHMRHLVWHSIRLPRIAHEAGAATVMSFHDFHALCPTIKLLDDKMQFCGGVCTPGDGRCKPELWREDQLPHLKHLWVHEWRTRYATALRDCDAFITTSSSTRQTLLSGLPNLDEHRFHVVPHGRDFGAFHSVAPRPARQEPFRILAPGNINHAKGLDILEALAAFDAQEGSRLEFHVLGRVQRDIAGANVIVHGAYEREAFADRVKAIAPHAGAVFSIWDETWCHTLTELWSVGVPALTFDFPTIAGRVREFGAGWILDQGQTVQDLHASILAAMQNEDDMAAKRRAVQVWQVERGSLETTRGMADRYASIYNAAMQRNRTARLAFSKVAAN